MLSHETPSKNRIVFSFHQQFQLLLIAIHLIIHIRENIYVDDNKQNNLVIDYAKDSTL